MRRLCLVLERGAGVMSLASSTHSCGRDLTPGLDGHMALNTTSSGKVPGGCGGCEVVNGVLLCVYVRVVSQKGNEL